MQEGTLSALWESQVPEHARAFKDPDACKLTQRIKREAALFVLDPERSSPFLGTDAHEHCATAPPPTLATHPR